MSSKPCKRCGEEKSLTDFYAHSGCKGGYRPECKSCVRARAAAYRTSEEGSARRAAYRASPEGQGVRRASMVRWRQEHAADLTDYASQPAVVARRKEYLASPKGQQAQQRLRERRKEEHPYKFQATNAVQIEINAGRLPRVGERICESCASPAEAYHHDSYLLADRLKVRPLCRRCHAAWHKENEPLVPEQRVLGTNQPHTS